MVGSSSSTFVSRLQELDDSVFQSGTAPRRRETCELCESETVTRRNHGLRVCATCDEEYLP